MDVSAELTGLSGLQQLQAIFAGKACVYRKPHPH